MPSSALSSKFNPFTHNPFNVYFKYKQNFKLPKCFKSKKKCNCFSKRKHIVFSFDYPMSFIQIYKKHIKKNIFAYEKHNILDTLTSTKDHTVKYELVSNLLTAHIETLEIFLKFINSVEKFVQKVKIKKFIEYIKTEKKILKECLRLYKQISKNKQEDMDNLFSFRMFISSLYHHYHTLKLFECFVYKLK